MGFTWIFEIIQNLSDSGKSHKWYWVILDLANIFQAVAIFVIFVCKRETLRALEQNYPKLRSKTLTCFLILTTQNNELYLNTLIVAIFPFLCWNKTELLSPLVANRGSAAIADRSTEGSTKISRVENGKSGVPDGFQRRESVMEMT